MRLLSRGAPLVLVTVGCVLSLAWANPPCDDTAKEVTTRATTADCDVEWGVKDITRADGTFKKWVRTVPGGQSQPPMWPPEGVARLHWNQAEISSALPYMSMCWRRGAVDSSEGVFGQPEGTNGLVPQPPCDPESNLPPAPQVSFDVPQGFPLGIHLAATPGLGDWLSRSETVGRDSIALLPAGASDAGTGWQGASRPVLEGVVDLVTGEPLVQVTDLELPFGGAMFRLNRTRSGDLGWNGVTLGTGGEGQQLMDSSDRWWDWVGSGWMASEQPLLLIDSALPDVVGPNPRTTWLVLDAHRSIPFQQVHLAVGQENEPRMEYEAPPRFRARLSHNGTWGMVESAMGEPAAGWLDPPTEYKVSLYDGLVTYTFVAVREDMGPRVFNRSDIDVCSPYTNPRDIEHPCDPDEWSPVVTSDHDLPLYPPANCPVSEGNYNLYNRKSPGWGIPYYGLCTKIEDRFGNAAEIEFCGVARHARLDEPASLGCVECAEQCARKGMISQVRLTSHHGSNTEWTLVYVHRLVNGRPQNPTFTPYSPVSVNILLDGGLSRVWPDWMQNPDAYDPPSTSEFAAAMLRDIFEAYDMPVIDRIYAYKGSVSVEDCVRLDPYDLRYGANADEPVPTDWVHQVRYFYRTAMDESGPDAVEYIAGTPLLVRTQVTTRRAQNNTSRDDVRSTVFRYVPQDAAEAFNKPGWDSPARLPRLSAVFSENDVAALRAFAMAEQVQDPSLDIARVTPESLSRMPFDHALINSVLAPEKHADGSAVMVEDFASLRLQYGDGRWDDSDRTTKCDPYAIPQVFVKSVPAGRLMVDPGISAVCGMSVRGQDGNPVHYMIRRLVVLPEGSPTPPTPDPFWLAGTPATGLSAAVLPMRSVYVAPYRWATVQRWASNPSVPADGSDLAQPRWISIIDTFADRKSVAVNPMSADQLPAYSAFSSAGTSIDERFSLKQGQLSRRVVQASPSGHVLNDKTWDFRSGQAEVSGGGLGESYIYKSLGQLRDEGVLTPADVDADMSLAFPLMDVNDTSYSASYIAEQNERRLRQRADFLRELLLVERRSIGWSAADLDPNIDEETLGLVQWYRYAWLRGGDPSDLSMVPLRARCQLVAEGIQQGSGSSQSSPAQWLTRQVLREASNPCSVTAEISFLAPTTDSVAAEELESLSPLTHAVTRFVTERLTNPDVPVHEQAIVQQRTIGPAQRVRPGPPTDSAGWKYPVSVQALDEATGTMAWSGEGLVANPDDLSTNGGNSSAGGDSLVWVYTYNLQGRMLATVADASPGLRSNPFGGPTFTVPAFPADLQRIAADPELNLVTAYEYDEKGLTDIYYPGGKRWAKRMLTIAPPGSPPESQPGTCNSDHNDPQYRADPIGTASSQSWTHRTCGGPPFVREYVFNDLEAVGSVSSRTWITRSAGQVTDFQSPLTPDCFAWAAEQGSPPTIDRKDRVLFGGVEEGMDVSNFLENPTPGTQPWFMVEARKKYTYDQFGRVSESTLMERSVDGTFATIGFKQVNDLGEMYRERDMEGAITRIVKDAIGLPLRKYVGTIDDGWTSGMEGGVLPPVSQTGDDRTNLVLTDRWEYGTSPTDARLPVRAWKYTSNEVGEDLWIRTPYDAVGADDDFGQRTETRYDWRMRAVRTDVYSDEPRFGERIRLRTTLTFLDHAGRTRMTVVFGEQPANLSLSSSQDPSLFGPNTSLPSPSVFLAMSPRPLSITEMMYESPTQLTQRREYDMAWSGQGTPEFWAEYTYTGRGGNVVHRRTPGGATEVSKVDGLGRVYEVATVLDGGTEPYELARTDTVYDPRGNVKETTRWERVVFPEDPSTAEGRLSGANAVPSTTLNWYDFKSRLVATATIGTERDSFSSNTSVDTSADLPHAEFFTAATASDPTLRPTITVSTGGPTGVSHVPLWLPAGSTMTVNHYNDAGNLDYVAQSTGEVGAGTTGTPHAFTFTKFVYSGTGKVTEEVRNCTSTDPHERQRTRYVYRFGKLEKVIADQSLESPAGTVRSETTRVAFGALPENDYGADVVDLAMRAYDNPSTGVISHSAGMTRSMHKPDATGAAGFQPAFLYRYDFLGRLAERVDARNISLRYDYDSLDRLTDVYVGFYAEGSYNAGYPEEPIFTDIPADRIAHVNVAYDPDGRSYTVTTRSKGYFAGDVLTQNHFEVDPRGNLTSEAQALGEEDPATSPSIGYAWDVGFANASQMTSGHKRLLAMVYPVPPGQSPPPGPRTVTLSYGAPGTFTHASSMIEQVTTLVPGTASVNVATFSWTGDGRRAGMSRANAKILEDLGLDDDPASNSVGLVGLDPFGRLKDKNVRAVAGGVPGASLTRLQYGYDRAGNRVSAVRTPSPEAGVGTSQEQACGYDGLQRLTESAYLSAGGGTPFHSDAWDFDSLGNWREHDSTPGDRAFTFDGRNRITGMTAGGSGTTQCSYDAAGNLIFDGAHAYQYDAWQRLVQVSRAAPLLANSLADPNEPVLFEVGAMVRGFTYDGVGRLVRTVSPWPTPEMPSGEVRVERYFYDGVRRISEVTTDPLESVAMALAGNAGSQAQGEAQNAIELEEELETEGVTVGVQQAQSGGGANPNTPYGGEHLTREYIWGPGDNGLDELLVQFDASRNASWPVQDAGGDLIALLDTNGPPPSGGTGSTARLVGEWTYDPYGNVVTRVEHHSFAEPRFGHKGLVVERLDGGIIDPTTGYEVPRLEEAATTLVFARNRHLHAGLGRWLQEDPNATGQLLLTIAKFHGCPLEPSQPAIEFSETYQDGANLLAYVKSSPLDGCDALGLFDFSLAGLMFTSTNVADLESDWAQDVMDAGDTISDKVTSYFADLAAAQAADLEWATDWDTDDTTYSARSTESRIAARREMSDSGLLRDMFGDDAGPAGPVMADRWPGHHVVAKFLGGAIDGATKKLPRSIHKLFHKRINTVLKKTLKHPENWGRANWVELLKDKKKREKAVAALRKVTAEMASHGYDFRDLLEEELKRQKWIP